MTGDLTTYYVVSAYPGGEPGIVHLDAATSDPGRARILLDACRAASAPGSEWWVDRIEHASDTSTRMPW